VGRWEKGGSNVGGEASQTGDIFSGAAHRPNPPDSVPKLEGSPAKGEETMTGTKKVKGVGVESRGGGTIIEKDNSSARAGKRRVKRLEV